MLDISNIVKLNLYVGTAVATENAFGTGLILGGSAVIPTSERYRKYGSIQAVANDFPSQEGVLPEEYKAAAAYFAQEPTPDSLLIGVIGSGETPVEALNAVAAKTGSFWGVYVCDYGENTAANVKAVADAVAAIGKGMLFYAGTEYDTFVSENGVLDTLSKGKNMHAFAMLGTAKVDAAAVMGRTIGLGSNSSAAFALCYKTITGVEPVNLTETQIEKIEGMNGNVYVTRGYYYTMLEHAATTHGLRVDEVYYLDYLSSDLQNAVIGMLVNSSSKIAQSDEGTAIIRSSLLTVLDKYKANGFLGAGIWRGQPIGNVRKGDTIDGYTLYVDSYANQTQADREAHKAMPFTIGVTLAGSVESVVLNVYAQR